MDYANSDTPVDSTVSAQRPSIVEDFTIEGLYGYRTVGLNSSFSATVLIAKNGSGKTTLIAALDAFLRTQFTRFIGLEFEKISCKLRGIAEPLVLSKTQVHRLAEVASKSEIAHRAKVWEVEPLSLVGFLEENIQGINAAELREHPVFYAAYVKSGYVTSAAREQCVRLAEWLAQAEPDLQRLRESVRAALGQTEVVYLPTYRRIELSLPAPDTRRGERRANILNKLGISRSGLHAADIQFGLGDISDRLGALNAQMLFQANQGYGKISSSIINDLISGNFSLDAPNTENWPSKDALKIFLSRIRDSEREYRRGPINFLGIPDVDRIYSGDIPFESRPFLSYFLEQLNKVIISTRGAEDLVEAFISNCNRYLSGEDGLPGGTTPSDPYDSKKLTFNRKNLNVQVVNQGTKRPVSLEALSSGEKQMISLFARLYLYPNQKIVLIDEPELSLSIAWQRRIIPDILNAPSCSQVIAITHSPFIFDNELEPFASSLKARINPKKPADLFGDSEFDEGDEEEATE